MDAVFTLQKPKSKDLFNKLNQDIVSRYTTITEDDYPSISGSSAVPEWLVSAYLVKPGNEIKPAVSSSTGAVTIYAFISHEQTAVTSIDVEMERLAMAARFQNEQSFINAVNSLDWKSRPVEDYLTTIRLCLAAGAYLKARNLAMSGGERFPDDAEMQKYARILAPAKVIKADLPPDPEGVKDIRWLKEHHDEYRGQWVALHHGELLGKAQDLKALIQIIGNPIGKNILVTQV